MDNVYRELLIGCGHRRDKIISMPDRPTEWQNLFTLDHNVLCLPDFLCDLNVTPWDVFGLTSHTYSLSRVEMESAKILPDDTFDEIHAYEVLEHLGSQGDAVAFFNLFSEIWRVLKPGGVLVGTCPSRYSPWLWGDPSHRRAILPQSLIFLSQRNYMEQIDCPPQARTPMSDFRTIYKADFDTLQSTDNHQTHVFCLQAVKPSRYAAK